MDYYDDTNTEYCPNCNAKVQGDNANSCITDDSRCSSCGVPLKSVRIEVGSLREAPYTIYAIEIDTSRRRN